MYEFNLPDRNLLLSIFSAGKGWNMIPQLCPDCCILLVKDRKKLGDKTNWMLCPVCGHRERPCNETVENTLTNYEHDRIKQRNKNLNQFNRE